MRRDRKLSSTLTLLAATTLAGVAVASAGGGGYGGGGGGGGGDHGGGPVVNTADGPVKGFAKNGVNQFLGIPYAAPPVGKLRWMPPQPPGHHGLLDATEFANTCPQVTELGAFAGPSSTTEDCLYLNVFTTGSGPKKPVLVWIHGGGNVDGESNDYDGSKLATNGIVVVSMNYRMGLFGFLSEQHLNAEGHPWGNYGILDQQAVLRWVKTNIAAFGGDATKVALGGQSAGSSDTSANLISPAAAGLFNRAINQSGPTPSWPNAATALSRGNAFASAANCSSSACLRGLSAERVLQLQGTPNANGPYVTGPFVDGTVIPIQPELAWTTGQYNKMPIMGGRVKDEAMFGLSITEYFSGPPQVALTATQYAANNPPNVLMEYPLSNYNNNPTLAQDRVTTDQQKCQALHVLKAQAASNTSNGVYGYDFTYQHAPYYFPQMPNADDLPTKIFHPLAYHTSDIQFQFQNWHGGNLGVNLDQNTGQPRELQGAEITLSNQLVKAWTNFTKTGNPNGAGAPTWPVSTPSSVTFLQQDIPNSAETEAQYRTNYKCDFWDPLLTYPTT